MQCLNTKLASNSNVFTTVVLGNKCVSELKKETIFECVMCREQGYVTIDTNERHANGRKKITLVVHHAKELADFPDLALEPSNLITICYQHHELIHNRIERFTRKNKWHQDEKW